MKNIFDNWRKGFTWPRIALAAVLAVLVAGILVFAIDPREQFAKMRNSQRRNDANVILNAIYQYTVDNGSLPPSIGEEPREICRRGADCADLADLSGIILRKKNTAYLADMPIDPSAPEGNGTGYKVRKAGDRVTVSAPLAEQGAVISATR